MEMDLTTATDKQAQQSTAGTIKAPKVKTKSRNCRTCCNCGHVASTEWMNGPLPSRNKCQNCGESRDRRARKSPSVPTAMSGNPAGSDIPAPVRVKTAPSSSNTLGNGGSGGKDKTQSKKKHSHRGVKCRGNGRYLQWDSEDEEDERNDKCGRLVGTDEDRANDAAINSMLIFSDSSSKGSSEPEELNEVILPAEVERLPVKVEMLPVGQGSSVQIQSIKPFPNPAGAAFVPSIQQSIQDAMALLKKMIAEQAPDDVVQFHWEVVKRLASPPTVSIPPGLVKAGGCPKPGNRKAGAVKKVPTEASRTSAPPATGPITRRRKVAVLPVRASVELMASDGIQRLLFKVKKTGKKRSLSAVDEAVGSVAPIGTRRKLSLIENLEPNTARKKRKG